MTQKRVIILIGKTGNGKSALANVLVNKNDNFEEVFKEGDRMLSETKNFQTEKFVQGDIEYTVIDTPGLNDTNPKKEEDRYREIVEAVCSAREGISQVLFV